MKTIGNRIKTARTAANLSQQALANAISELGGKAISRTAIAQWESGLTKEIEASNLLRASKVLAVTPEWLQFGDDSNRTIGPIQSADKSNFSYLRKIPWISNNQVMNFMDNIKRVTPPEMDTLNLILDDELAKIAGQYAFAISIKDNSMSPSLKEGDIVIIDPDVKPNPGEIVAAKVSHKDQIIIRKYCPLSDAKENTASFSLIPKNNDWPQITIHHKGEGHIIGTLIEHRCRRRIK